ncbi:hypothetical protein [Neorhizobium vignae]|jgi:hypothetical protein|uniref:hypothetical protein n=1 Tax=Neorhizobium vignae TaxID=690585 RepID=UPI0005622718|nr:hypothetical protein [Neorhizobium vignae]
MRFVPTLVHGVIDYIVGLIAIALPFMLVLPSLLDFPPDFRWPSYLVGVAALFLAATTEIRASGTAGQNDNKEIIT